MAVRAPKQLVMRLNPRARRNLERIAVAYRKGGKGRRFATMTEVVTDLFQREVDRMDAGEVETFALVAAKGGAA